LDTNISPLFIFELSFRHWSKSSINSNLALHVF
jgi:hypothetical protein